MMLHDFVTTHRQELITRTRAKVSQRSAPRPTVEELTNGVPLFLTQLVEVLKNDTLGSEEGHGSAMGESATLHGSDLLNHGFTIGQVVHDYGDVCQAVTELAMDLDIPISTDDFHTLNRCLDNSIASAVSEYSRRRDVGDTAAEVGRLGFFAHELRNHLSTAMLSFQAVKSGRVGVTGSTIKVLERSLRSLRDLIDRSVSEVRLDSGKKQIERLRVAQFVEEMQVDATIDASDRGVQFNVGPVDDTLVVDVDRQLFGSAISNLLHNAFKFTRPASNVWLRTSSTAAHVSITVEDECGGLSPGAAEALFSPFEQRNEDRSGQGLGLAISRKAIETNGGTISLRDIPGRGCVFTVEMPLAVGELPTVGAVGPPASEA